MMPAVDSSGFAPKPDRSPVNPSDRTCRFENGCRAFLVTAGVITSTLFVALSPAQFLVRATPGVRNSKFLGKRGLAFADTPS